ncbi:MAG: hypothetical protein AAF465_01825 [Pseudomonadota bacterium]
MSRFFLAIVVLIVSSSHSSSLAIDAGKYWNGMEVDADLIFEAEKNNILHGKKMMAASKVFRSAKHGFDQYDLLFHVVEIYEIDALNFAVLFRFPVKECATCASNKTTVYGYEYSFENDTIVKLSRDELSARDYPDRFGGTLYQNILSVARVHARFLPSLSLAMSEIDGHCGRRCVDNYAVTWEVNDDIALINLIKINPDMTELDYENAFKYRIRVSTGKIIPSGLGSPSEP